MKIEIDIDEYFTPEMIKEIAEDELRRAFRRQFQKESDVEREKAWDGVDAPIGSPEWEAAAGKIDTINNICEAVHGMNTESRSSADKAEKPVWKVKQSVVHTDYVDGSADTRTIKRASWCCPVCDWFVGEQVEVYGRKHNQQKKNFCDRCGQMIDWEGVEHDEGRSD